MLVRLATAQPLYTNPRPGPGGSWGNPAVPPPSKEGESPSNKVILVILSPPPHVRCNISAHVLFRGGWGEGLLCADSVVLTTHLSERNWLHRRYLFKNYKMIIGRTWGDRTPFSAVQIYFLFFVNVVYITILVILNSLGTFKLNIINILICLMTFDVYCPTFYDKHSWWCYFLHCYVT